MDLLTELKARNILDEISNSSKLNHLKNKKIYIGFDPTATSLHLGNYLQIMNLKWFKKFGYQIYAVLGGATGMIGDPSGKNQERNFLPKKVLENNKAEISKQLSSFGFTVVDNADFYKDMLFITFLRDVGKQININYMLSKQSVKDRIVNGLSFTEFSYQLIQGWDFYLMYKNYDVSVQCGGSDQWGNITTGLELIRKLVGEDAAAVGLTTKLLLSKTGQKFGKSVNSNNIWLNSNLTSPYEMYQYLVNQEDEDIEALLKKLTFLSINEIEKILLKHQLKPSDKLPQKKLAFEVVKDIHGLEEANLSQKISSILFENFDFKKLTLQEFKMLEQKIPTFFTNETSLLELLLLSGLAQSKREGREFINSGAVYINGIKILDPNFFIKSEMITKKYFLIKRGKKFLTLIVHQEK